MKRMAMIGLLMAGSVACWAQRGVMGNWATPDGSVVKVAECGSEVCLTVVKVRPAAPAKTDVQNPDASLRSRSLCDLRIGSGFKAEGADAASGGKLYDPKSGRTYSGKFWLKDDELHLRGFIGVSLFGRSEVWKRTTDPGACR
jgi:uncharacterized protein (DUF2147 family)